jgi:hypothetical protein
MHVINYIVQVADHDGQLQRNRCCLELFAGGAAICGAFSLGLSIRCVRVGACTEHELGSSAAQDLVANVRLTLRQ